MKEKSLMKLFVALLCLCFTSCSKDDDETNGLVTITPPIVYMYHDDTKQLSATNAINWSTEDDFIAEVDNNGLVTGGHIGTTNIIATNGKKSAKCEVTIMPKYNLFDTPILDWGASLSTIKSKEYHDFEPQDNSTMIGYNYVKGGNSCAVFYYFKDDKLTFVDVYFDLLLFDKVTKHLLERYTPLGTNGEIFLFADGYTKDKMTLLIGLQTRKISSTTLTCITYHPYEN